MKDLLNDVVNDLADGHITKTEAMERIDRIMRACDRPSYVPYPVRDYWPIPSLPQWPYTPGYTDNTGTADRFTITCTGSWNEFQGN